VFVPDAWLRRTVLEVGLVDFLEDILEAAVIGLEDGVLGGEIQGTLRCRA
jgi:hypothetical protein